MVIHQQSPLIYRARSRARSHENIALKPAIWRADTSARAKVKNGYIYIPKKPGLGVEVDEKKIRKIQNPNFTRARNQWTPRAHLG